MPVFTLDTAADGMEGRLSLPDPRRLPGRHELEEAVTREFGSASLDLEALAQALEAARHQPVEGIVVARGISPCPGTDGRLEWLGDFFQVHQIVFPDGRVDHYHRQRSTVYPGQPILEIHPPTPGRDGLDVMGQVVPGRDGTPVEVTLDDATAEWDSRDSTRVLARVGGIVEWVPPRLSVSDVLEVTQVDFGTGAIEFDGAVRIADGVQDNFDIWARGSVDVGGWVGNCSVTSGSQVTMAQGIIGRDQRAAVCAEGDIWMSAGRGVRCQTGANLVVSRELLWCETQVEGDLLVETGRVVEGIHRVAGRVVAGVIGSNAHVRTTFILGSHRERRRVGHARRRRCQVEDQINALLREHPALDAAPDDDPDARSVRERLAALREEEARRRAEEDAVVEQMAAQRSRLWVRSLLHPGTRIRFSGCQHTFKVHQAIRGPVAVVLDEESGEIVCQTEDG